MLTRFQAGLRRHFKQAAAGLLLACALPLVAQAQKKYDPGASDTEIKIGSLSPHSGPASAYGTAGKAMAAYFDRLNAAGGINGRKINFLAQDDAYNPAKSVEQTRKLVEQDEVLFIGGYHTESGLIARQLKEQGAALQIFGGDALVTVRLSAQSADRPAPGQTPGRTLPAQAQVLTTVQAPLGEWVEIARVQTRSGASSVSTGGFGAATASRERSLQLRVSLP